ncbi:hypothetical protein L596_018136 [Steinernema carpocapsae]|uniref:Uncharacterized protein n=1 Tax=Steinernema carpocapsae TaxID=34508 RepID=A0A4U5N4H1_STECR|nr:hypothetical protein L596_018136 [Steinernema carpocapsae]
MEVESGRKPLSAENERLLGPVSTIRTSLRSSTLAWINGDESNGQIRLPFPPAILNFADLHRPESCDVKLTFEPCGTRWAAFGSLDCRG